MKRKRLLIYIIAVLILIIGAYYKGIFSRYNFVTAYFEILTQDYQIAYIGEYGLFEKQETIVAPKLGFRISRTYGCDVNSGIVNGTDDFNKIMGNYINKHVCSDWQKKLNEEAQKLSIQDSILPASTNELQ